MLLTLLSHDEAIKKLAFGLNFKQLIVSDGGCCTSISLFGLAPGLFELKLKALLEPNIDIFQYQKSLNLFPLILNQKQLIIKVIMM